MKKESNNNQKRKITDSKQKKVEAIITFTSNILDSIEEVTNSGKNSFFATSIEEQILKPDNLVIFIVGDVTNDSKKMKEASEIFLKLKEVNNPIINGLAQLLGEVANKLNNKDTNPQ